MLEEHLVYSTVVIQSSFQDFDSTNALAVDTDNDLITLPNHFSSGERLKVTQLGLAQLLPLVLQLQPLVVMVLLTNFQNMFMQLRLMISQSGLAASAEDALASNVGNYLDLTTVGIGTSHTFTSQDQNTKCIVALDNNIQDPVIPGNVDTLSLKK